MAAASASDDDDTPSREFVIRLGRDHIKFANLRAGIGAPASRRQLRALFDDDPAQAWRAPPPAGAPRGASARDMRALGDEPVLFANVRARPVLDEDVQSGARGVVGGVARGLHGLGFRFYRTLGWGGQGVAVLMYLFDATGAGQRVVAKISLRDEDGPSLAAERAMSLVGAAILSFLVHTHTHTTHANPPHSPLTFGRMILTPLTPLFPLGDKRFRGQYHILQRQFGEDLTGDPQWRAQLDATLQAAERRVMLFEFAQYGSLLSVLKRASPAVKTRADPLGLRASRGQPLPDRAILAMMHCLASACNDLRAPAAAGVGARTGLPMPSAPVVHLDLEPSNMLFGGTEAVIQPEHNMMPILKVADFGLASDVPADLAHESSTELIWQLRTMEKPRYFLPEQFSQDWDYCRTNPVAENIATYGEVAGRYGPASNVYHVGLALWSCITGVWPQLPTYDRLAHSPVPRVDGAPYWTWWADILDDALYGAVDRQIRQAVLACLVEEPRRRIDSQTLLDWCAAKTAQLRLQPGSMDEDQFDPFDPLWGL